MAVEAPAPYPPPEWAQWQPQPAAPTYVYAAPPPMYQYTTQPVQWTHPSAAAYVARVPPPTASRPVGAHPYGAAAPGTAYSIAYGEPHQPGGLPPRAPSPGPGYGATRGRAPGQVPLHSYPGVGPMPAQTAASSSMPLPSSSFEHAHLARRNARLEERLADAAREKREMAAHFEQLLAQARAEGEKHAADAAAAATAPLEAELRAIAEAAERYRNERDFLHAQLASAASARSQLEAALQEARGEVATLQGQRECENNEALAAKGGPATQLLASARRARELAAEREREAQMEDALRLAENARVAAQVAQAEVAALKDRADALRGERDDAKAESHRWEARFRDLVAQCASSPSALAAAHSASHMSGPEALAQLQRADLSASESSHIAEQLSAAKDELHRLRAAHDAALARLAQQGRLLAAAAAASVDARRAAAQERAVAGESADASAAEAAHSQVGHSAHAGAQSLAVSLVVARVETLLVEVQGVAGVALAAGGARWDDEDSEQLDGGSEPTHGEQIARSALTAVRQALQDMEFQRREEFAAAVVRGDKHDDEADLARVLLELKALCLRVIIVCAAMARRTAVAAPRVSAVGQPVPRGRLSHVAPAGPYRSASSSDTGGPVSWMSSRSDYSAAAPQQQQMRRAAVISPTPIPTAESPRLSDSSESEQPSRRRSIGSDRSVPAVPQRRGQSRSASPYSRRREMDESQQHMSGRTSVRTQSLQQRAPPARLGGADSQHGGGDVAALTRRASSAQGQTWGRYTDGDGDAADHRQHQASQQFARHNAAAVRRPSTPPVSMARPPEQTVSPHAAKFARGSPSRLRPDLQLRSSMDSVFPARSMSPAAQGRPRSAADSRPPWRVSGGAPAQATRTGLFPREPRAHLVSQAPHWR